MAPIVSRHIVNFKKDFKTFFGDNVMSTTSIDEAMQQKIDAFVTKYIYGELKQNDVDNILRNYGLTKAMARFHDFHVNSKLWSCYDFCNYFKDPELRVDCCMVELILLDSVNITKLNSF
jgi:hypothetical protein